MHGTLAGDADRSVRLTAEVEAENAAALTGASQPLRDSAARAARPAVSDRVVMERLLWGAWI